MKTADNDAHIMLATGVTSRIVKLKGRCSGENHALLGRIAISNRCSVAFHMIYLNILEPS